MEGHSVDKAAVGIIHAQALAGGHVPHTHSLVVAARDCQAAVWAEAAASDPVAVPREGELEALPGYCPHLHHTHCLSALYRKHCNTSAQLEPLPL